MTCQSPFALFVLSDETDIDWINVALHRTWEGNFKAGWNFWVASDDRDDAPKLREDGRIAEGTVPPMSKDFTLPWLGKSPDECAKWLQNLPPDTAINKDYFAVLTEYSKEDDTITACRVVKLNDANDLDVEYFPQDTKESSMQFATNDSSHFVEKAQAYKGGCRMRGKPDRSRLLQDYR